MKNKTKEELLDLVEEQDEQIKKLENDVDYWQREYDEISEKCDELETQIEDLTSYDGIKNMDNFIWKLKLENLYDDKLESFIDNYLKFHNN